MKKSYIKDEIQVIYHYDITNELKRKNKNVLKINEQETFERDVHSSSRYKLFYVIEGNCNVQNGAYSCKMSKDQLMVVDSHIAFGYRFPKDKDFKCLYIQIYNSFFRNIKEDKNFLRPFEHIKPTQSVIDCNNEEMLYLRLTVSSIIECIKLQLAGEHVIPRVNCLISQLCIYADKHFEYEEISTDAIHVRIIDFINRNYTSDITYQTIMDKFFVSKPVINEILHKLTGMPLREYVEYLRIKQAQSMLNTDLNINRVAELCGFRNYSTFYRAYKRVHGVPPSEKKSVYLKKWPLT